MPLYLVPGLSGMALWLKTRFLMSAAERRTESLATFTQRAEMRAWVASLEHSAQPVFPSSRSAEDCPVGLYEGVRDACTLLSDERLIEINHLFGQAVEDATVTLRQAMLRQLRAVNELLVPTQTMAASPHFKPRRQLLGEYAQTGKLLHAQFLQIDALMEANLRGLKWLGPRR